MRNLISLLLLSCTLFLNAQTYSFEKTSTLEDLNLQDASDLIAFKNILYFQATEYSEDYSSAVIYLCKLNEDKTTTRLTPICTEETGSYNWTKFIASDKFFFTKKDNSGNELWYTEDGVTFSQVADIFTGADDSNPSNLCVFNNQLYFSAYNDVKGSELYSCDLNTLNVSCLDLATNEKSSNFQDPCVYNNKLYFSAFDETNGSELWSYDGTNAPTIVSDFVAGSNGLSPQDLIVFNDILFFTGTTDANGSELFKYDGTNVSMVADINTGTTGSHVDSKTINNNKLYFSAYVENKTQLCVFDGTSVKQVVFGPSPAPNPSHFIAFDGNLFGQAHNSDTGTELFYLADDVVTMLDIEPAMIANRFVKSSKPESIIVIGDKLYFVAEVARKRNIFVLSKSGATAISTPQKQVAFSITPNPASDFININLGNGTLQGMVTIFDISGQQVISQTIEANNNRINISALAKGIYIVSFNNGTETFMQKVRIQ